MSWSGTNSSVSASWNGSQVFATAVKRTGGGRNSAILYLDNPAAATANIALLFGASTTSHVGVISTTGLVAGAPGTTTSVAGTSGTLVTSVPSSLVVGAYSGDADGSISGPFGSSLYQQHSQVTAGSADYQIEAVAGGKSLAWPSPATGAGNVLAAFASTNPPPALVGYEAWIGGYTTEVGSPRRPVGKHQFPEPTQLHHVLRRGNSAVKVLRGAALLRQAAEDDFRAHRPDPKEWKARILKLEDRHSPIPQSMIQFTELSAKERKPKRPSSFPPKRMPSA